MKTKSRYFFLLLLLILLSSQSIAFSQDLPPMRWWKEPAVAKALDLKKEQIDRIEEIFRQSTKAIIDQKAETEKHQFDLGLLLENEPLDKEKVLAQADRLEASRAKLSRIMLSILIDVRNVLTLEQWQKFQEMRPALRSDRIVAGRRENQPLRRPLNRRLGAGSPNENPDIPPKSQP
jgi:Spy/CpxP family protein refolding chaperone